MRFTIMPGDLVSLRGDGSGVWTITGTDEDTGRRWVICHDAAALVVAVRDVLAFDQPVTFDVPASLISHRADSDDPPRGSPGRGDRRRLLGLIDGPPVPRRVVGEQWGMPGAGEGE
jgi:hypothetical protein